jgi:hypothetical protein
MEMQSNLLILPPEIWGSITEYLDAKYIGRLKLTGDKTLWTRLTAPRAVKRLEVEFEVGMKPSWPGFVNDLPTLEDLVLRTRPNPLYWRDQPLTLAMMPKTLRRLTTSMGLKDEHLFWCQSRNQPYPINQYLPMLEELSAGLSITSESDWHSHLPETLTSLSIGEWNLDFPLPPSITFLKVERLNQRVQDKPIVFPHQLVSFQCSDPHSPHNLLEALPTSLRTFVSLARDYAALAARDIARLPKDITDLDIGFDKRVWYASSSVPPESHSSVISWPTALTRLRINYLPMELWQWLPRTLSSLRIESVPYRDRPSAFPGDSSREGLVKCSFEVLPASLTHLVVNFAEHTLIHPFGASETARASSSSTQNEPFQFFPPTLKVLKCTKAQLTVEAAKQLPCSLTKLDLYQLNTDVCGVLPRDLKSLRVHGGVIFTPDFIKNLPRALTHLHMPCMSNEEICIVEETGEAATYAALWKRSPSKYDHQSKDTSMLWQGDFVFPTTLTELELRHHEYLDDRCVATLSKKLNICDFSSSRFITDLSIPLLPRYLAILNLASAIMVTSRTFKDLPRQLEFLSLASSKEIFDEHIKALPRGLKTLNLDNAVHLTNSCIKDLPNSLESISMSNNLLITPACFPDFPPGILDPSAYYAFQNAKWRIDLGEVKYERG